MLFSERSIVSIIFILLQCGIVLLQNVSDPDEAFCTTTEGHDGVCISLNNQIRHCPKLKSHLKNPNEWENLRRSFCSPEIENGRVCCPIDGNDGYQDDTQHVSEQDYRKHENWPLFSLSQTKCGLTVGLFKVVGGKNAYLGQFPWMARIGYIKNDNEPIFSCSGTIINKRYILTAAHCLLAYRLGYRLAPIRVAENDDSINPEISEGRLLVSYRDFEVDKVHFHENYTGQNTSPHDIALIRLKEDIANLTTDYVTRAICLPFVKEYNLEDQLDDDKLVRFRNERGNMYRPIVAGWGKADNNKDTGSSILQYLPVPVQPSILCRILYPNTNFSSNHLCVGGEENKNSCWGDSGGPLMQHATHTITTKSVSVPVSRKYQIGIVSYGRSECGQKGVPVVYTRIRDYLSWILDTVKP